MNRQLLVNYFFYLLIIVAFCQADIQAMHVSTTRNIYQKINSFFGSRTIFVPQNNGNSIELAPHESGPKIISTNRLIGCIATVCYIKDKAQYKRAFLTHYSGKYHDLHCKQITYQYEQLQEKTELYGFDSAKFIVIMPTFTGHISTSYSKEFYTHFIQIAYDRLTSTVEKVFEPKKIEIIPLYYDVMPFAVLTNPNSSYLKSSVYAILCNSTPQQSYCSLYGPSNLIYGPENNGLELKNSINLE